MEAHTTHFGYSGKFNPVEEQGFFINRHFPSLIRY